MRSLLNPQEDSKNDVMIFDGMFFDEVSHQIANSQGFGLLEWLNDISDRRENKLVKSAILRRAVRLRFSLLKNSCNR